jgi:hypothetical protein
MRAAETVSWRSTSAVVRPGFHAPDDGEPAGVERWAGRPQWREGEWNPRLHAVRVILPGVEELHPVEARRRHPMTVNDVPPSSTGRPMASSRPSRWVRQKYSVTTATGAAAARSSSGLTNRPRSGVVRRTLKKSPETKALLIQMSPWLPAGVIRRSPSAPIASSAESAGGSRMIATSLNDSGAVTIRRPPPPDSLPVGLS